MYRDIRRWFVALLTVFGVMVGFAVPAASQVAWPKIGLETLVTGLEAPVYLTHAGDGSGRLFVVEQAGRIRIVREDAVVAEPFLDISGRVKSGGEQGLLSVAFPPGYAAKGYFYVDYTDTQGDTVIARYHLTADPDVADPASEEVVLLIEQPYDNHNGGQLAFGPDGYLYIGMGDGGAGGDPEDRAQNPDSLLGKILRLDVESDASPYGIPATNPFTNTTDYRGEIWALGLRNPWRFSFDAATGDLYIGDVGQNAYEEVDYQPAESTGGENYGWNILEGNHCYEPPTDCVPPDNYVGPIIELAHVDNWHSLTGGYVYRGPSAGPFQGTYLYAGYINGQLWGAKRDGTAWPTKLLLESGANVTSFGQDQAGNLYLVDHGGTVYRIVDQTPPTSTPTATTTDTPIPSPTATVTRTATPVSVLHFPLIVKG